MTLSTILYTIGLSYCCNIVDLKQSIPVPFIWIKITSAVLFLVGVPFFIISVKTLLKGFPSGKLMKNGVYKVCRNPLYSSLICFIVPALALLTNSLLFLTVPIFMYLVFKFLIRTEEEYLESTFGQEYLDYKKITNQILPKIKRAK